jgi:RNA polymerase sigma-70 factor (ECF subfamily)
MTETLALLRVDNRRLEGQSCAGPHSSAHRMSEQPDESRWMAAYAAGDDRAFQALFRALAPRLLAFFRRSLADAALCEDLVQTTFVRLHAARASYRAGAPVRPWVFTIAARVRIDELRRRQRRPRAADDRELEQLPADSDDDPDFAGIDAVERAARDSSVRDAIEALPPGYRMVIHLHRFEGLSFPEIGSVLGCSAGAARIRAFRAYAILRERLRPLVHMQEEES